VTILTLSIAFFALAALGGAVLARSHIAQVRPPGPVVVGHPLLAASGLILLGGAYVRGDGSELLTSALIVLALAAVGGGGLAFLRVRRGRVPATLIGLHALVALSGIVLLVLELFAGAKDVPPPV